MKFHLPLSKQKESSSTSKSTASSIASSEKEPPSYERSTSSSSFSSRTLMVKQERSSTNMRATHPSEARTPSKTNKNVPYRPSAEQQQYIDKLGSSESVTALSATTSAAHTQYFDVLPSFQMFQSILKRDDEQFSENLLVEPPRYGDTMNSSPTPPDLSPMNSNTSSLGSPRRTDTIDGLLHEHETEEEPEYDYEENYGFGEDEANDGLQNNNREYYSRQNISTANATFGHTVLDNIDRLAKLNNSPIDIQIFVTKDVPNPGMQNELETRLKEYSNGDLINGYIVIKNTSSKPINFGLFTVSLEGTVKAVEKNPNSYDMPLKISKILMKKFLKMYDFNASYGYINVPNSAGIEYEAFTRDPVDGCILGLPNERVLEPNEKYKKYFTFKFPNKLLDTTCPSNILPHILPPPSLGIDRTSFGGKADNIELNKALGYGFTGDKGTPLLTRDYGFEDMSISYTIEAKFIDRINDDQNNPISHNDINESDNEKKYVISRGTQYFLRFIPDLKELIAYYNEEILFGKETFGSIGIDGKLFANYMYTSTWRALNQLNSMIENEINVRLEKELLSDEDIKHKNLFDSNYQNTINRRVSINEKESRVFESEINDAYYRDQRMIGSKFPTEVYGKKKKSILSSLIKIGHLKLYVRVPSQPIMYSSAKLIMKYNTSQEGKNDDNELVPVNSITSNHIKQLYQRIDDDFSRSVDISIVFDALDDTKEPPAISSIECNIVAWSFKSEYPLPCKFEYDFFYDSLDHPELKDQVEITKSNLQLIKNQTAGYVQFLKANKTFISKEAYLYLKSIKTLGIKTDTIREFFKPINATTNPEIFEKKWVKKSGKWTNDIQIPLEVLNKHNVNLIPSFQSCLVGRLYCLQVAVKYKGGAGEKHEFADNLVTVDVPILVG